MIENSKDILYIVISFCIIWVTVFFCWMMYYAGKILRNVSKIIDEFRLRLHQISEIVNKVHGKVDSMSGILNKIFSGKMTGACDISKAFGGKADEWLDDSADIAKAVARKAVQKAVDNTAKKIHKLAKRMK